MKALRKRRSGWHIVDKLADLAEVQQTGPVGLLVRLEASQLVIINTADLTVPERLCFTLSTPLESGSVQ